MCLKTDKGNAKLNSSREREGTMKASRWDTFGENFNLPVSFLACLPYFFFFPSQIGSVERLKAFLLFLIFCLFFLCGLHSFFYLPSDDVEAVPIFLVLFLTPSCAQQYFHWIRSFMCTVSLISFISPVPLPPPYLLLTLAVPGILQLS